MENCYKKAKKYVKGIRNSIKNDMGFVPDEWEAQLVQLEDMYANYLYASMKLREGGDSVVKINAGKTVCASAYFNVMIQSQKAMDSIIKQFGLNPSAKKKLKGSDVPESKDYLDNL